MLSSVVSLIVFALATTAVCINRPVFYFAQAGLGIFTDFATLAAPLPFLWKLQMPVRQKIGVSAVLMMGGFVCIGSCSKALEYKLKAKSIQRRQPANPQARAMFTDNHLQKRDHQACRRTHTTHKKNSFLDECLNFEVDI
mgnify:CR=1 FL=1